MYSVDDPNSFEKAKNFWKQLINKYSCNDPRVYLVGHKSNPKNYDENKMETLTTIPEVVSTYEAQEFAENQEWGFDEVCTMSEETVYEKVVKVIECVLLKKLIPKKATILPKDINSMETETRLSGEITC